MSIYIITYLILGFLLISEGIPEKTPFTLCFSFIIYIFHLKELPGLAGTNSPYLLGFIGFAAKDFRSRLPLRQFLLMNNSGLI